MKNLGTPLNNEELLSLKGGNLLGWTCYCQNGLSHTMNGPMATEFSAQAWLEQHCLPGEGYCEYNYIE